MKRLCNYPLLLLLLVFTAGTCAAQSASKTNIENKTKPAPDPGISDITAAANNDVAITIANFQVDPNPTKGMITVKTDCVGKIHFYSQKGKEKGVCMVNEGTSQIFLENVLNPGVYTCKFEGINGSIGSVQVVYKP